MSRLLKILLLDLSYNPLQIQLLFSEPKVYTYI